MTASRTARAAVGLATAATLVGGVQSARAVTYGPETHALSQQFAGARTPGGGTVHVQPLGFPGTGPSTSPAKPHPGTTPGRTVARTHPGTNPGRVIPGGKRLPSAVPANYNSPTRPTSPGRGVGSPVPPPTGGTGTFPPKPAPPATPGGGTGAPGAGRGTGTSHIPPGSPIGTNIGRSHLPGH